MNEAIKDEAKTRMENAIESLIGELKKVRTGRANVSMLDTIKVDYYGSATPLNQVAAISCPDAKSFLVSPWEANILKDVEQAIVTSNIGMAPQNDGKVIRMKLPDITEDRRKDMVKNIKKIVEDARIAIRMARRDANEVVKKALKDKEISEDQQKQSADEIQKLTDGFIKKVDEIGDEKEKDLMTI